jgi:hypothetical protein
MARHRSKKTPRRHRGAQERRPTVSVRLVAGRDAWELVHPRCARDRAEDIEEVEVMVAAGEYEVARDELRWLLQGCADFIAAHRMLGELALGDNDPRLARGHFGYAYQIGLRALPPGGLPGPLPYDVPANRAFLESAKGLAWCLRQQGETTLAQEIVKNLLAWDASDPLGVGPWQSG